MDDEQHMEFESAFTANAEPLLEWFVLEGGELATLDNSPDELIQVDLRGISYYIGPPTEGSFPGTYVEVAALIYENPPFDESSLRAMTQGIDFCTADEDPVCFGEFNDEAFWFAFRLNREMLLGESLLQACMEGFVSTAEKLHGAVH